jgi:hypothetical protein
MFRGLIIAAWLTAFIATMTLAFMHRQSGSWAQNSVPPQRQGEQSCWSPGLSRNIGIAEPSCDDPRLNADNQKESKIDGGTGTAGSDNRNLKSKPIGSRGETKR